MSSLIQSVLPVIDKNTIDEALLYMEKEIMREVDRIEVGKDEKSIDVYVRGEKYTFMFPSITYSFEVVRTGRRVKESIDELMPILIHQMESMYQYEDYHSAIKKILDLLQRIRDAVKDNQLPDSEVENIQQLKELIDVLKKIKCDLHRILFEECNPDMCVILDEIRFVIEQLDDIYLLINECVSHPVLLGTFSAHKITRRDKSLDYHDRLIAGNNKGTQVGTITLYVRTIQELAEEANIDYASYVESVFFHELFHAIHFCVYAVDKMRNYKIAYKAWTSKSEMKQSTVVKECLATYFQYLWINTSKNINRAGASGSLSRELIDQLERGASLKDNPYSSALQYIHHQKGNIDSVFNTSLRKWEYGYEIIKE